jgi:hypothetical protein
VVIDVKYAPHVIECKVLIALTAGSSLRLMFKLFCLPHYVAGVADLVCDCDSNKRVPAPTAKPLEIVTFSRLSLTYNQDPFANI